MELLQLICSLFSPHDRLKVKGIYGDFGLADDPIDESITWGLRVLAGNETFSSLPFGRHAWTHQQQWRTLGSPAQVIQTMTRVDNDEDQIDVEMHGDPTDPDKHLALVASSSVASSIRSHGMIVVEHTIRQRRIAGMLPEIMLLAGA